MLNDQSLAQPIETIYNPRILIHSDTRPDQQHKNHCETVIPLQDHQILSDPKDHIVLHRIKLSQENDQIVIMMPEINRVLKKVFQIMSQANYYLQKLNIAARRFSSEELMNVKIMGLIKNDVKVCSYITLEQSIELLLYFEKSGCIKKAGGYTFSSCVYEQEKTHMMKDANQIKIPESIEIEGKEYVALDKLANLLTVEQKEAFEKLVNLNYITIETVNTAPSSQDSLPKNLIHKKHADLILSNDYKNLIPIDKEDHDANNEADGELCDKIELNVYKLDGKTIVALPDISKAIKIANGFTSENPGIHSATLRQVNYYLAKLKSQKRKLNFHQMQTIRRYGTDVGNATYCSYISLTDAKKLIDIFKRLPLKHTDFLSKIFWKTPIEIDWCPVIKMSKKRTKRQKSREPIKLKPETFETYFTDSDCSQNYHTDTKGLISEPRTQIIRNKKLHLINQIPVKPPKLETANDIFDVNKEIGNRSMDTNDCDYLCSHSKDRSSSDPLSDSENNRDEKQSKIKDITRRPLDEENQTSEEKEFSRMDLKEKLIQVNMEFEKKDTTKIKELLGKIIKYLN